MTEGRSVQRLFRMTPPLGTRGPSRTPRHLSNDASNTFNVLPPMMHLPMEIPRQHGDHLRPLLAVSPPLAAGGAAGRSRPRSPKRSEMVLLLFDGPHKTASVQAYVERVARAWQYLVSSCGRLGQCSRQSGQCSWARALSFFQMEVYLLPLLELKGAKK